MVELEILTIEARIVVASVDTFLRYAEAIGLTAPPVLPCRSRRVKSLQLVSTLKENSFRALEQYSYVPSSYWFP